MRRPEDVAAYLRDRFERDYPDWARGSGTWPMRIGLRPPSTAQRAADAVACHAWADEWSAFDGPGTVEYTPVRFPTGMHRMPKTLVLTVPRAVAATDAETLATWRRCGLRLTALQREFPNARFKRIIRRITELPERDYERLAATVRWLRDHPTSGMLLRQLPIEGIGTKWLARHARLVLALLSYADDNGDGIYSRAPEENGATEPRTPPNGSACTNASVCGSHPTSSRSPCLTPRCAHGSPGCATSPLA